MSYKSKIPGIKAKHLIVTPNCQKRKGAEIEDVVRQVRTELEELKKGWSGHDQNANFHVVVTVERLSQ